MANGGCSLPDPYRLSDTTWNATTFGYRNAAGLTARSFAINSGIKNLVLITAGQSLWQNISPTLYTPTNSSAIDNFSVYDGNLYNINGPLQGCSYNPAFNASLGPGNVAVRLADNLINSGNWTRVILVPVAIGGTFSADWAAGGIHNNRVPVAIARLAARGITPGMSGVTFACLFGQGHADYSASTSQATQTANLNSFISTVQATAFGTSNRIFVTLESASGQTSNGIRSAQAAVMNNTSVFSGGDTDSATITTVEGVHPSDAGAATMATIVNTAIHASGAPY